ncbi:TonB-dependent receptor [uncultured Maribacter sp.]|uniref:TonB-dependent receptor n=1 Tax=uncultured Maribacter sp. TaxID=431308 RepID=UPI00261210AB|nr:TonB-dependent receptor [uncultured Maribacter sp.]
MNKTLNLNGINRLKTLRFCLMVMQRTFILLICVGFASIYANSSYAQTKIDIQVNNVKLDELFNEIQTKSEFIFFYKDDVLDKNKRISLNLKKVTLSKILNSAFLGTNLSYTISDRQVIIKKQVPNKNQSSVIKEDVKIALQSSVSGVVSDSDGSPLPGANVLVKGTTNGTQTDFDGNYTINADSDATLVFSYIGFKTQEIAVNGQSNISITLSEDASQLEEVVVLGYATQTRGDITGSVASVDMDEALKAPTTNAAEALQGRASGVTVIKNNTPGSAPKINIRGFGTTNNTDPLYIIDGVQTDDANFLNNINPADIDQMNVLKDGAAAIYGARASNGVVIITTKSGGYNMDKAEISVDMYTGFSKIANSPNMLNAQQHADMIWASLANDGSALQHGQYGSGATPTIPESIVGYTRVESYNPITFAPAGTYNATVAPGGTDWVDALTQTAPISNFSVSLSNGTESGKYFMSVGYLTNEGVLQETGFDRISTRLNSEFKIGERLRIGEHLNVSYSKTRAGNNEALQSALRMTPLLPVKDDNGEFAGVAGPSLGNTRNPVAQNFRTRNDYTKRYAVFGDVYLTYKILDELTFKTSLAGGFNTFDRRAFVSLDPEHGEPISDRSLTEEDKTDFNWLWANTLNYNKSFGQHSINALIGVEALKGSGKGKQITRSGYFFEDPNFYLLNNGTGAPNVDDAYDGFNSLFSIFGTASYSFADKYFATVTVRQDESSRFLGDNKSDIFPSFSGGWQISNEGFYPSDAFVNRLKIKGSWGKLGNQSLPVDNPTANISILSDQYANYALSGTSISTGAILSQVGNTNLKWETSETTNFGIELSMLESKLTLEAEYFNISTKDLITQDFSAISSTAIDASAPYVNLGNIKNTGFDFSLGYQDQTDSGLTYGISANLSHYKNEVTALIDGAPVTGTSTDLRGQTPTRTEVGEPLSFFYGRRVVGFTDEGRFAYADIDGDGDTDDDDRTNIGSPHPDFTYGININSAYKGFDVSLFFNGSQGNEIYNFNKFYTDFPAFVNGNRSTRVLDSWTPTNTNATLPALSTTITNNEGDPNSYYVEDGSFFRLKNTQIGYSLPDDVVTKIGMKSLRIYVQATNLFTLTDYQGFDPEVITRLENNESANLSLGIDGRVYPAAKTFTLGANIKF